MNDFSEKPTCPFCLKPSELVDSHIIPWGIWRLKDTGSGFLEASSESELQPKRLHKGWYEKLLCKQCDHEIGKNFDQYGRDFFALETEWKVHTFGPPDSPLSFSEVTNFSYEKLKLFILSVLWRSSLATNSAFSNIKLRKEQEARLREMIKTCDAGDTYEFGCAIFKYFDDGRGLNKIALAPRLFRASGCVRYAEIQLNEFACRINVSNQKDKERYDQAWLNPEGPLRIHHMSPERKIAVGAKTVQDQHKRYQLFRAAVKSKHLPRD